MNALAALPLLAHHADGDHHWWPLWLLLWAAVLGTAAWLLVRRRDRRRGDPLDRAREVLAERYARGELTGEEYRTRLDDLERATR